jgi:hypothetical protein
MTAKIIASIIGILIGLCLSFFRKRNPRKILIILCISTFVDFVIYRTWAIWCDAYIDTYGIGIYTMNVYHPTYADIPKVGLFLSMIAVETFIINKLFNLIGLDPNYMYTLGPNDNAALSLFYNMLPVPLLYTFLMILIFMGLAMIELFILRCSAGIMTLIRNRKKE